MAAMTLDDLRAFREKKRKELTQRQSGDGHTEVIVGMGTCGIAAGAKATFSAIVDHINAKGIDHVVVKQTGCMGLCASEPTVEVKVPGMPGIVYGHVDTALGTRIVDEHIVKGKLLGEHIFDKPSADIVNSK